ncbi:MAG TPA: hypothetical protein PLU24_00995, partial [Candidatus Omnitrophota bacterium]|nr:hypothetical protein [Candidatus Omnitrophota bacterium]
VMMDIPAISISLDIKEALRKNLIFKNIELDLKHLTIIRNKDKILNTDALKTSPKKEGKPEEKEKPAPEIPLKIEMLKLNVGQIVYKDYSKGEQPIIQVYDSDIKNKTYTNITSPNQLVTLILAESLKNTAIQGAKVYAASAILGVGFLPAGVAVTLLGKDSAKQSFDQTLEKTYNASISVLRTLGTVKTEDKAKGLIKGSLADKTNITIKIAMTGEKTTEVTISAKKMLLPKPEIAKGLLLELSNKLK